MLKGLLRKFSGWNSRELDDGYARRLAREREVYRTQEEVHDLPPIFHYWSNKYLRPVFEQYGFSSPDDFFRVYLERLCRKARENGADTGLRFLSIGAGNCDLETRLARSLLDADLANFRIECLDINEDMIERGKRHAERMRVADHLTFVRGDFNRWQPDGTYDAVIANQCLHHVLELEHLFDAIARSLAPQGYFLVSDMIGRNGHLRWPEALAAVQTFWKELPDEYRFNRLLNRHEPEYINHDCSEDGGFEGIRAQDILSCLIERFHFLLFIPFANVVDVFVDRAFGHNFDPEREWDRHFIDRVQEFDEAAIREGRLTPTHMVAALTTTTVVEPKMAMGLSPEQCVRTPDEAFR